MNATQTNNQQVKTTVKEFCELGLSVPFSFILSDGANRNGVKLTKHANCYNAQLPDGELHKGKGYILLSEKHPISYILPQKQDTIATSKKGKKNKLPNVVETKTEETKQDLIAPPTEVTPIATPTEVVKETIPDSIVNTQMIDWLEKSGDVALLAKLCRLQAEFLQKMAQKMAEQIKPSEVHQPIALAPQQDTPPAPKKDTPSTTAAPKKADSTDRDRFTALTDAIKFIDGKGDSLEAKRMFYWANKDDINVGRSQFNQYVSAMRWTQKMFDTLGNKKDIATFLSDKFTFSQWVEISVREKALPTGTPEQKEQHALSVAKKYFKV